jgi:DNA modification methylase
MGIPWAIAFALRADGWYLRQDIIWHKPNPMPESVRDRCTKSHEYLFLLSKSERYLYDGDAIAEPSLEESIARSKRGRSDHHKWVDGGPGNQTIAKGSPSAGRASGNKNHKYTAAYETAGTEEHRTKAGLINVASTAYPVRNKRSVWTVGSEPFPEAHFASFPPKLIEPCIKAGCPAGGAVLDPFGGAGTSALVAASLGRSATLIELNPEYVKLARARIEAEFMGKEEGARHMIRSLGKIATTFEPGSLFAGLEVELPATASDIRIPEPTESVDPGQIATGGPEEERPPTEIGASNASEGDGARPDTAALTGVLNAVSAAIEEKATYQLTEQTDSTAPPGPDLTGESIGLKRVSPGRGETVTDRLRAHPLLDTAASALGLRSQTTKLPDGTPMFLKADVPRENVLEHGGAGLRSADARRRR